MKAAQAEGGGDKDAEKMNGGREGLEGVSKAETNDGAKGRTQNSR